MENKHFCSYCHYYKLRMIENGFIEDYCTYICNSSVSNDGLQSCYLVPYLDNMDNDCPYYSEKWTIKIKKIFMGLFKRWNR